MFGTANYVIQLTTVIPAKLRGTADTVRLLEQTPHSLLWDFDYTWEAYTPSHKRVRGYYALPILSGLELVGHIDAKADRPARKLIIVSRRIRRGHRAAEATREFARWLGLK